MTTTTRGVVERRFLVFTYDEIVMAVYVCQLLRWLVALAAR